MTLITYHHDVKHENLEFWLFQNLCSQSPLYFPGVGGGGGGGGLQMNGYIKLLNGMTLLLFSVMSLIIRQEQVKS